MPVTFYEPQSKERHTFDNVTIDDLLPHLAHVRDIIEFDEFPKEIIVGGGAHENLRAALAVIVSLCKNNAPDFSDVRAGIHALLLAEHLDCFRGKTLATKPKLGTEPRFIDRSTDYDKSAERDAIYHRVRSALGQHVDMLLLQRKIDVRPVLDRWWLRELSPYFTKNTLLFGVGQLCMEERRIAECSHAHLVEKEDEVSKYMNYGGFARIPYDHKLSIFKGGFIAQSVMVANALVTYSRLGDIDSVRGLLSEGPHVDVCTIKRNLKGFDYDCLSEIVTYVYNRFSGGKQKLLFVELFEKFHIANDEEIIAKVTRGVSAEFIHAIFNSHKFVLRLPLMNYFAENGLRTTVKWEDDYQLIMDQNCADALGLENHFTRFMNHVRTLNPFQRIKFAYIKIPIDNYPEIRERLRKDNDHDADEVLSSLLRKSHMFSDINFRAIWRYLFKITGRKKTYEKIIFDKFTLFDEESMYKRLMDYSPMTPDRTKTKKIEFNGSKRKFEVVITIKETTPKADNEEENDTTLPARKKRRVETE